VPSTSRESKEGESFKQTQSPLGPQGEEEGFVAFWNSHHKLRHIKQWTPSRSQRLAQRMSDKYFREHWREGVTRASRSRFCTGGGARGWKANVDWFLTPDTLVKLM